MERAVAAFRLTFERTPNEDDALKDIPRIKTGWPCQRDFGKWPMADMEEWVCAPTLDYIYAGLAEEQTGDPDAVDRAWRSVFEYLRHIGIDLDNPRLLRDSSTRDLVLNHYRRKNGYDCERVALDFFTFPPIAKRIRELEAQQQEQNDARARQKRESKARRKARREELIVCNRDAGDSIAKDSATRLHKIQD
jgi:hypothetical protein